MDRNKNKNRGNHEPKKTPQAPGENTDADLLGGDLPPGDSETLGDGDGGDGEEEEEKLPSESSDSSGDGEIQQSDERPSGDLCVADEVQCDPQHTEETTITPVELGKDLAFDPSTSESLTQPGQVGDGDAEISGVVSPKRRLAGFHPITGEEMYLD